MTTEKKEVKKHDFHRNYWPWKPWRKLDNWEPMKKRWRKTGTVMLKEVEVWIEAGTIMNYVTFWKSKIEHPVNKKLKLQPNTPLTVQQACREYGITPNTFYTHLNTFPSIKQKYEVMKVNRREYLKEVAEATMVEVLENWDLTDKEKFDASFKVAQATMKEYNPKTEIETKSIGINLTKSSDDLRSDLAELLWIKN